MITWRDREAFGEYISITNCYQFSPWIQWNTRGIRIDLLIDLCKVRINCILHTDKDYVEQWIQAIAQDISVAPGPNIKESLSYPPDIVDDTEERMDDMYVVEDTANQEEGKEKMIAETSEYKNDDGFNFDEIQE